MKKTWLIPVVGVALLAGGCSEDTGDAGNAPAQESNAPASLKSIVEDASGPVEDPEIKAFFREGELVSVIAATPGGGFEGASTQDLDWMAGGIFDAIYGEGAFKGRSIVKFSGGLVDSSTGQDLPDALTAEYKMSKADSRRIDWSDQDAIDYGIDWSLYRVFVHPAIKKDG